MAFFFCMASARPASAQELQGVAFATDAFDWQHELNNLYAQPAERPRASLDDGLSHSAYALLGIEPHQQPGKLGRFARLAGMFMGRVSALSIGDMAICFNLEIR